MNSLSFGPQTSKITCFCACLLLPSCVSRGKGVLSLFLSLQSPPWLRPFFIGPLLYIFNFFYSTGIFSTASEVCQVSQYFIKQILWSYTSPYLLTTFLSLSCHSQTACWLSPFLSISLTAWPSAIRLCHHVIATTLAHNTKDLPLGNSNGLFLVFIMFDL